MVPSNLSILPPRGCSGCTPQAAGWWENIQDTARTEGSFHWLLKLSLHFPPPTRKSQPLLETSCVMQRNIPTKPCLRQLGPPPSPSPKLCAPHLASTFPALPSAKRGICFSLPSQHLAEGQSQRCLWAGLAARGTLVLPLLPPGDPMQTPAPFSAGGFQAFSDSCPLVSAHRGELEAWEDFEEGKIKRKIKLSPSPAVLFEAVPIPSGCSPPPRGTG